MHDLFIAEIYRPGLSVADSLGLSSVNFTHRTPLKAIYGKMVRYVSSVSSKLAPTESLYATSD